MSARPAAPIEITDVTITSGLKRRLRGDPVIGAKALEVATRDGVVTLTGTVRTIRARKRTVAIASACRGVRSVVDRLAVKITPRDDVKVERDIDAALRADPAIRPSSVEVSVNGGKVTIHGTVASWARRRLVQRAVEDVKGVASVNNRLTIADEARRPDPAIKTDISTMLRRDARVDSFSIVVNVDRGRVTLDGYVGTEAERRRAASLAWVRGVKDVQARTLEVRPSLRRPLDRKTPPQIAKLDPKEAVMDALKVDPRVDHSSVTVRFLDSTVILTGEVSHLSAKRAAAEDAKNTAGVVTVKNELVVDPVKPVGTGSIERKLRAAISRDPDLQHLDIRVRSDRGTVRLSGEVTSAFHKRIASELASRINGVRSVDNQLQVRSLGPERTDAQIRRDLRAALFWDARIDEDAVYIQVDHGRVTLSGHVSSAEAFHAATEAAWGAGARLVINRLTYLTPPPRPASPYEPARRPSPGRRK